MRVGRAIVLACALLFLVLAVPAHAVVVPGDFPTIQQAINAVVSGALPDGTLIQVQAGTFSEALLINATPRSLTIQGAGPGSTVVNATGTGQPGIRILSATGSIRVEGVMVTGGTGGVGTGGGFNVVDSSPAFANCAFQANFGGVDGGGGVLARSNATFSGCTILSNTANRFGGGVLITEGSRPVFVNCTIQNNVSGFSSNIGSGGGLHVNDASPTFQSSVITGNQSKFAGGGIVVIGIFGSAFGPATLVLDHSTVSNNTTSRFSGADPPAEGGGVHIEDNTVAKLMWTQVRNNVANTGGGLNSFRARYEIMSSVVESNQAPDPQNIGGFGGGIGASSLGQVSTLILTDSVVRTNTSRIAGGIFIAGDAGCGNGGACPPLTVTSSLIDSNSAATLGGGIHATRAQITVVQSQVFRNRTTASSGGSFGGGFFIAANTTATITDTTIADNTVNEFGGGLFVEGSSVISVDASRIYRNSAGGAGGGIFAGNAPPPSGTVQNSIIADNTNFQIREQVCPGSVAPTAPILSYLNNTITPATGQNNIYQAPCFPPGNITSIAAFNNLSPGVKTVGNNSNVPSFASFAATPDSAPSVLAWSVARATTINITNVGSVPAPTGTQDVSPPCTTSYVLTANPPVGSLSATVMGSGATLASVGSGFFAYNPAFVGGVFVGFGRVTTGPNAGTNLLVTGAGPGGGPHVMIFRIDAAGGATPLGGGFFPYNPAFAGGVSVAFGDIDGDGVPEIITGAGPGGGPHVRLFKVNPATGVVTPLGLGFFPYDPAFLGGVSVGTGDLDADGSAEIVTGAGPGGGPHVRVFKADGAGNITAIGLGFFPYDPNFRGGVAFAAGDLTGAGTGELITAPGPGGGPHVRLFNVDSIGNVTAIGLGFFAFDVTFTGGVSIAVGDLNGTGKGELITAAGPSGAPTVRVFSTDATGVGTLVAEGLAYHPAFAGGVRVAAGDIDGDGRAEIFTGPGPGGGPNIRIFNMPPCP